MKQQINAQLTEQKLAVNSTVRTRHRTLVGKKIAYAQVWRFI